MIWLSYRQARLQWAIGLGVLLAGLTAFALTGPAIAGLTGTETSTVLSQATQKWINSFLYVASILLTYGLPALFGAFWGAPLVAREVENGTHRLAWTQGVGRTRWLAFRLGTGAAVVLLVSGLLTLAVTWWAAPLDRAMPLDGPTGVFSFYRMSPFLFGVRGLVPIGYALFAFALGVVLGMVTRRTLVALGLTMAVMLAVQVSVPVLLRAHLAAPVDTTVAITLDNLRGLEGEQRNGEVVHKTFHISGAGPADWVLDDETVDRTGAAPNALPDSAPDCMPEPGGTDTVRQAACLENLAAQGLKQHIVYHPESAFWTLQWRETGLLLTGAALLTGFAFWRVRQDP